VVIFAGHPATACYNGERVFEVACVLTSLAEIHLAIACPMANGGEQAVRFVQEVIARCDGFRRVNFFAVLDRATLDNTVELLRAYKAAEPQLTVVWAPENRCVVDAYVRGYREALGSGADWVLEIDAGFSHDPEDMSRLFAKMREGYDCVFGSRFMPGAHYVRDDVSRYLVSRGGTLLSNLLLGTSQTDMTSGFELFSRCALESVLRTGIQSRAHFFQTEIKVYCRRLKFVEVPIHYRASSPGLGSSALKDSVRQLGRLFRLRMRGALPVVSAADSL
jgi:dolichol-phosphate mannosyltransferase